MKKFISTNIVILRTDRIGEVMLSTAAVDILKANFPQAKISLPRAAPGCAMRFAWRAVCVSEILI